MKRIKGLISGGIRRRLVGAASTFAVLTLVLTAAVIGGKHEELRPASARKAEPIVYVLSYCDLDTEAGLSRLRDDIGYMKDEGLDFILPDELGSVDRNSVILIAEGRFDPDRLIGILKEQNARAVFLAERDASAELRTVFDVYAASGLIEPAAPIGKPFSPIGLMKELTSAREAFFLQYGRDCSVFVHSCSNIICTDCFGGKTRELPFNAVVFIFGNGKNEAPYLHAGSGLTVLNRVMHLPDWSIEQFFTEIAK